jgi:hypothetical protein
MGLMNPYEKGMAKILLSGSCVTGMSDWNERLAVKYYIEGLTSAKQTVTLGASRIMQLTCDLKGNEPNEFFCSAVSGATLEDLIALYGIYDRMELIPKCMIIGVEPYIFNSARKGNHFQALAYDFARMMGKLGCMTLTSSFLFDNPPTKDVTEGSQRQIDYQSTTSPDNILCTKRVDGSHSYDLAYRSQSGAQVRAVCERMDRDKPLYGFSGGGEISQRNISVFRILCEYIISHNIKLELLLAPYHELLYSALMSDQRYCWVALVEHHMQNLAANLGIALYGSYNPAVTGCTNDDFYDEVHSRQSAMKKCLNYKP